MEFFNLKNFILLPPMILHIEARLAFCTFCRLSLIYWNFFHIDKVDGLAARTSYFPFLSHRV